MLGNMGTTKALGVLRLSRSAEESTSIERQKESIKLWAAASGATIVDWAEDDGVSGDVSAFDRPALGPWLTEEKAHAYDVLVGWKIDRLSRNTLDFLKLWAWLQEHGKDLAVTDIRIDTTTPGGKVVITLLAALAEFERSMTRDRILDSQKKLRSSGRWRGGRVPVGYKVEPHPEGGKRLVPDEITAPLIRKAVEMRLGGASQWTIANWLERQGVTSSTGKPLKANGVRLLLRSYTLIGQQQSKGVLVTDEQGEPIRIGDPIIPEELFKELQAFEANQYKPKPATRAMYLLRDILHCGSCGRKMYRNRSSRPGGPWYYVCSSPVKREHCPAPQSIRFEIIEPWVDDFATEIKGRDFVPEKVFIPGEDHTRQLDEARAHMARLRMEADAGLWQDELPGYIQRMKNLKAVVDRLSGLPQRPDRYELRPTDKRYAEAWQEYGTAEKRQLLLDLGLRIWIFARDDHERAQRAFRERIESGETASEGRTELFTFIGERGQALVAAWDIQPSFEPLAYERLWEELSPEEIRDLFNAQRAEDEFVLDVFAAEHHDELIEILKAEAERRGY